LKPQGNNCHRESRAKGNDRPNAIAAQAGIGADLLDAHLYVDRKPDGSEYRLREIGDDR